MAANMAKKATLAKVQGERSVEELLNDLILEVLGGPGGDPDYHHHRAAALAFIALKKLGLTVENEEERRRILQNEEEEDGGNIYEIEFLTQEGWTP